MVKLIRDKVATIIIKNGSSKYPGAEVTIAHPSAKFNYLKFKLREESEEVAELERNEIEDLTEELADVLEVIYSLADEIGISFSSIQEVRHQKRFEKGGFMRGYILRTSEEVKED